MVHLVHRRHVVEHGGHGPEEKRLTDDYVYGLDVLFGCGHRHGLGESTGIADVVLHLFVARKIEEVIRGWQGDERTQQYDKRHHEPGDRSRHPDVEEAPHAGDRLADPYYGPQGADADERKRNVIGKRRAYAVTLRCEVVTELVHRQEQKQREPECQPVLDE